MPSLDEGKMSAEAQLSALEILPLQLERVQTSLGDSYVNETKNELKFTPELNKEGYTQDLVDSFNDDYWTQAVAGLQLIYDEKTFEQTLKILAENKSYDPKQQQQLLDFGHEK